MKILRAKANPIHSIVPMKSNYEYRVDLINPKTREVMSSHQFKKTLKENNPKESAWNFAEQMASQTYVVDVKRTRRFI